MVQQRIIGRGRSAVDADQAAQPNGQFQSQAIWTVLPAYPDADPSGRTDEERSRDGSRHRSSHGRKCDKPTERIPL